MDPPTTTYLAIILIFIHYTVGLTHSPFSLEQLNYGTITPSNYYIIFTYYFYKQFTHAYTVEFNLN